VDQGVHQNLNSTKPIEIV